jgi:hypothetical protein
MAQAQTEEKQNVTVSLSRSTLQKARVIAAQRSTSISGLLAQQIDALVTKDEAYQRAKKHARAMLRKGFHMGGGPLPSREELHER